VLRGQDDRVHRRGLAVAVAEGDLRLRIGSQPGQLAVLAHLRLAAHQPVRVGDRGRHQHVRLVARVAEHQALVACALQLAIAAVHALVDVGRLLAEGVQHRAAVAVEPDVGTVVTDGVDDLADDPFVVDVGRGGDLAGQHDHARLGERLARDAGVRVVAMIASRMASEI